jgi:hypothetical protein
MEKILIKKDTYIHLTPEIQKGSLGRKFRLSSVRLDFTKSPVWIAKQPFHCTIYTFRYLDDGSFFGVYLDEYNKFSHKLTHADCLSVK